MYSLKKRDSNSDYAKRQILLTQEGYKVFVPFLLVLVAGLMALNIANAVHNFMAVYICVLINVVGIGVGVWLVMWLIRNNTRQQNLFAQLEEKRAIPSEAVRILRYKSDTDGILEKAQTVCVYETQETYEIVPQFPRYKHSLFTRYDFRGDFGWLSLHKSEYDVAEEENAVRYVSENTEFHFTAVDTNKK